MVKIKLNNITYISFLLKYNLFRIYGLFGFLITFYGLICGFIVDWLGVKKSIMIGGLFGFIGRILLIFTTSEFCLYLSLTFILPIGEAFGIPILVISIRRNTV
jgi:dipeptide/tripeptide permease